MRSISTLFFSFGVLTSGIAQHNQLFVGANNNQAIMSCLMDGSLPTEILSVPNQSFYNGVFNHVDGKLYLSWYYGIHVMNVDGSGFNTLYSYPAGGMGDGIDVDENNGYIYFSNSQTDSIYRMDLNGSNLIAIYGGSSNANYPSDVELDTTNGFIYYGDRFAAGFKGLYRIDLNGMNKTTIIPGIDVTYIDIDYTNGKIYYCTDTEIRTCNLNGSSDVAIMSGFQPGGIALDVVNNKLYTTDMTNNKVVSAELNGQNPVDLVIPADISFSGNPLESPHGPVLAINPTIGLNEYFLADEISVYPNPTMGDVTIELNEETTSVTLKVRGINGQLISETNYMTTQQIHANIADQSGVYFIEILVDDVSRGVIRVLKK